MAACLEVTLQAHWEVCQDVPTAAGLDVEEVEPLLALAVEEVGIDILDMVANRDMYLCTGNCISTAMPMKY